MRMHRQPDQIGTAARQIAVIFLEDDHGVRLGLTDYLRLNSIDVTDVASVADFSKAIKEHDFDVALLDVNLPDGSGFEVLRQIRESSRMGVIILTARTDQRDRLTGYEGGADIFMLKPADGKELVLAIRNLARRVRQETPQLPEAPRAEPKLEAIWRFSETRQHLVTPAGIVVKLSGREARLIKRMAEAKGALVLRKELAQAIGYDELTPDSRSLDAVLRRLRSKVRQSAEELPVHAVHAMGFRFAATLQDISI